MGSMNTKLIERARGLLDEMTGVACGTSTRSYESVVDDLRATARDLTDALEAYHVGIHRVVSIMEEEILCRTGNNSEVDEAVAQALQTAISLVKMENLVPLRNLEEELLQLAAKVVELEAEIKRRDEEDVDRHLDRKFEDR